MSPSSILFMSELSRHFPNFYGFLVKSSVVGDIGIANPPNFMVEASIAGSIREDRVISI